MHASKIKINCIIPTQLLPLCAAASYSTISHVELFTISGLHTASPKLHRAYKRLLLNTDYSLFKNVLGEYVKCTSTAHYFTQLVNTLPAPFKYLKVNFTLDERDGKRFLDFLDSENELNRLHREINQQFLNIKNN